MANPHQRPLVPSSNVSQRTDSRSQPVQSPRRNTSVACLECKKKRAKCTGGVPCAGCVSKGTECIKNDSFDGRKMRQVYKRKLEELESDHLLLQDLLRVIRMGQSDELDTLIDLIQNNHPIQNIATFIQSSFPATEDQTSSPDIQAGSDRATSIDSQPRRQHLLIQDLITPPISVPAKPWTTVTNDDALVSRLMSTWFAWCYWWSNWIDQSLFLEAMQSGNLDSQACTPCIVNLVLADACFQYEANALIDGKNVGNLRNKFYAEAEQYLVSALTRPSLATSRELGLQWSYLGYDGRDRDVFATINKQNLILKNMTTNLIADGRGKSYRETLSETFSYFQNNVARSIDVYGALMAMALRKPGLDEPAARIPIFADHHNDTEMWTSYPQTAQPRPGHRDCFTKEISSLASLAGKINAMSIEHVSDSQDAIDQLSRGLYSWLEHLPSCLRLDANAIPHVLALHALYNCVLIVFSEHGRLRNAEYDANATKAKGKSPMGIDPLECALDIARLFELHCAHWSTQNFPPVFCQSVSVAMFVLLAQVSSADNDDDESGIEQAVTNLWRGMRLLAQRFPLANGIFRMLQLTVRRDWDTMPAAIRQLYEQDNDTWNQLSRQQHQQYDSDYPHYTMSTPWSRADGDEFRMNHILKTWDMEAQIEQ